MITKQLILLSFCILLGKTPVSACFCGNPSFCEMLTDASQVIEGKAISFYESANSMRFIDFEVTSLLSGMDTLSVDTVTYVDFQSSCDLFLYETLEVGEKGLFMFGELLTLDNANHPTFNVNQCGTQYLRIDNDSIFGKLADGVGSFDYKTLKDSIDVICSTLTSTTSHADINSKVKISPNPVHDYLEIDITPVNTAEITVYSSNGAVVETCDFHFENNYKINTIDYSPGVYYLQIRTREQNAIKKFIKM